MDLQSRVERAEKNSLTNYETEYTNKDKTESEIMYGILVIF